jgi:signal transduction histidine kinase
MNTLDGMGDEIRKTAHNLMPEALLKQDLPEAIRAYCNAMQSAGSGLQIDFQYFGSFDTLTQEFKLSAYRIIQELLKNIRQHAAATYVLVELQMHEHTLAITVEDNGAGFDAVTVTRGMGLQNMQTRVRSFDGEYTLETSPGKGTSVYLEFDKEKITKT